MWYMYNVAYSNLRVQLVIIHVQDCMHSKPNNGYMISMYMYMYKRTGSTKVTSKPNLLRELIKVGPGLATHLRLVGLVPPDNVLESGGAEEVLLTKT